MERGGLRGAQKQKEAMAGQHTQLHRLLLRWAQTGQGSGGGEGGLTMCSMQMLISPSP